VSAGTLFEPTAFVPRFDDDAAFKGASIGLTGARGVLGSLLGERLRQRHISTLDFPGDVTDEPALAAWFGAHRFSHFLHFAALVPVGQVEADPLRAYQANVIGTFNICRQLALTQPDCWLFQCSSSHVYQPTACAAGIAEDGATIPQTFYGITKLAAEQVVATLLGKLERGYCIGRVFSFSHERQAEPYLVPSLRRKIRELPDDATLQLDNPASVRDIQDASEVIEVILHLAARRAQGTVNIGTGTGRSVRDIALAVATQLGRSIAISGVDRDAPGCLVADTHRLQQLLAH
jgi:nucleoside-diphosphate-sugar epimerase